MKKKNEKKATKAKPKPKSKPKAKPYPFNQVRATFGKNNNNLGKQILNMAGAMAPHIVSYMSSGGVNLPQVSFH